MVSRGASYLEHMASTMAVSVVSSFKAVHDKSRGLIGSHDAAEGLRTYRHKELGIINILRNKIIFEFHSSFSPQQVVFKTLF